MTAPMTHPAWCSLANCTAYADPAELELVHCGEPVVIEDRSDAILVVLTQAPARFDLGRWYPDGDVTVEILLYHLPVPEPWWFTAPSEQIALPLNPAATLARALRHLIREASS
jgi:hypothetical protein